MVGVFLRPSWGPVPLLAPLSLFGCLFACSWFGPCFPCRRFVFGFVFRFLSCLAPLCGVFVVLVFLPAFLRVSFLWPLCASLGVVGLLCVCPFLGCCRLPPPSLVASLPPVVGPLWRPGPVSVLVPPSGYLVAFATARLPCLNAWGVVVLCRPHFILSHGSKGLWPCVGFVLPSTPCCMCCCGALYSYAEVFIC